MLQFMYYGDYDIELSDTFDLKSSSPRKDTAGKNDAVTNDAWTVAEVLVAHVYAFVIGDKYDVAELKTLAAGKFKEEGEKLDSIPTACFIALAEIVYRETSSPSLLRGNLMKIAVKHRKTLLADKESVQKIQKGKGLEEFEVVLVRSLNKLATKHQEDAQQNADAAAKELASVKSQLETVKKQSAQELEAIKSQLHTSKLQAEAVLRECTSVKSQRDTANKKIAQIIKLNNREYCRQCGQVFVYWLEVHDGGYLARCVYCRTRHYETL